MQGTLFGEKRLIKVLPDFSFKDISRDPNVRFRDDAIEFFILDGGEYDGDFLANGIVEDPIIFADVNDTDLALSVIMPARLVPNQSARFHVRIANIGSQLAMLPTVDSDPLPASLGFISASDGGTFDPASRRVTWMLDGPLPAGVTKAVHFTVTPTTPQSLSFSLKMRQDPFLIDTQAANDTALVTAQVQFESRITARVQNGHLIINGDDLANDLALELGANGARGVRLRSLKASLNGGALPLVITGIRQITINLGAGNDELTVRGFLGRGTTVVAHGGPGRDRIISIDNVNMTLTNTSLTARQQVRTSGFELATLRGGSGDNQLDASGFTGEAILEGLGGNDTLTAARGPSRLFGGEGNDVLVGTPRRDLLDGGPGRNTLRRANRNRRPGTAR